MALMSDKRVRHLPVIDDGNLLGLVSIGDWEADPHRLAQARSAFYAAP